MFPIPGRERGALVTQFARLQRRPTGTGNWHVIHATSRDEGIIECSRDVPLAEADFGGKPKYIHLRTAKESLTYKRKHSCDVAWGLPQAKYNLELCE